MIEKTIKAGNEFREKLRVRNSPAGLVMKKSVPLDTSAATIISENTRKSAQETVRELMDNPKVKNVRIDIEFRQ